MRLATILLAAGRSRRFGRDDKLLASLHGRPLVEHAAAAIRAVTASAHFAMVSNPAVASLVGPSFTLLHPHHEDAGLGDNIAFACRHVVKQGFDQVLIHLGDMPLVPTGHLATLAARCAGSLSCAAATCGAAGLGVPASFRAGWLDLLAELEGDAGAAVVMRGRDVDPVEAAAASLRDVDQRADLKAFGDRRDE